MNDAIRTFICVDIPPSVRGRIERLQNELRRVDAKASWVRPSNIHLTIKFLGDVPGAKLADVVAAARRAVGSCSPFQVTVGGAGCFPSPRNPSVLWVGLAHPPEPLLSLRRAVEDELAGEGFARETKAFNPHLTIARLRNPRNARPLAETLIATGFAEESFTAGEVVVMRSELSPQGSIYTPLSVLPLQG